MDQYKFFNTHFNIHIFNTHFMENTNFQSPFLNPKNILFKFVRAEKPVAFKKSDGSDGLETIRIFEYDTLVNGDAGTSKIAVKLTSKCEDTLIRSPLSVGETYICSGFFDCVQFDKRDGGGKGYSTMLILTFIKPQLGAPVVKKERKGQID